MTSTTENKELIDQLSDELKAVKLEQDGIKTNAKTMSSAFGKRKLPARSPNQYKYTDQNFPEFAKSLRNYMLTMAVPTADRTRVLLSFLDSKSFAMVTRIYTAEELHDASYDEAVDLITTVLTIVMSESDAMQRLMSTKQGSQSILDFISTIEKYGKITFPKESDRNARDKCMTSALISGVKNSHLAFEMQKFKKENPNRTFSEMCVKSLELEALCSSERNTGEDEFILNVVDNDSPVTTNTKPLLCWTCQSPNHKNAVCPDNKFQRKPSNYNQKNYRNNSRNFNTNHYKPRSYQNNNNQYRGNFNRFSNRSFHNQPFNNGRQNNNYRNQAYRQHNNNYRNQNSYVNNHDNWRNYDRNHSVSFVKSFNNQKRRPNFTSNRHNSTPKFTNYQKSREPRSFTTNYVENSATESVDNMQSVNVVEIDTIPKND